MTSQTIETREEVGPATVDVLVDSLGLAWAAFTLYEDPTGIDSFARALHTLARCPAYPHDFVVGPDGFIAGDELVPHKREATVRVARRLFGLGASGLQLVGPPSGADVLRLFRILAAGDTTEPTKALRAAGVTNITVLHTSVTGDVGEPEGDGDRAWYISYDGDPEPFITSLLASAGSDARAVAGSFVAEYERVHDLIEPTDRWGAEEVTHAFVDAFWYLPSDHRSAVFSLMLERRSRPENLAFLDQFGTMELAEVNRTFGSAGHPLLAEYLRVAAEEDGRQTTDLSSIAGDPNATLGRAVIDQVASVLSAAEPSGTPATDAALDRLRSQAPKPRDHGRSAGNVIRGLLATASDEDAFLEAASVWAIRVTAALRGGNVRAAEAWMRTAAAVDLDPSRRSLLMDALRHGLDDESLDTLVDFLVGQPDDTSLLRRLAPLYAASPLVHALGAEPEMARRKRLIAALTPIARTRPTALVGHLEDPRWYLVRNVILLLGTSGHRGLADEVVKVAAHEDPRVRLEVLRALSRLRPDRGRDHLLRALNDPAIAGEAASVLATVEDAAIDLALGERLDAATEIDAQLRLIDALGKRRTDQASAKLREVAQRRLALFGTARRLKRAARAAIGGARD
ncbi:MAG TPA: HEAT repeat domain-containing protein [Acidimicrobiia bacterium]|nr:HEAT repeat domain-containing protein [Acidimicrobiia bacterium]